MNEIKEFKEHLNLSYQFLKKYNNIYTVTDLHGRFDLLMKLYDEFEITENDLVISLGDNIDRGSESFELMYYFLESENAYSIQGNHERTFCEAILNPTASNQVELIGNGGDWTDKYPKGMLKSMAQKTNDLPLIITLDLFGKCIALAHAHIPELHLESTLNGLFNSKIQNSITSGFHTLIPRGEVKGADLVLHGHRYVNKPTAVGNRIYMDTGASNLTNGSERNRFTVGHIDIATTDFRIYSFLLDDCGALEWDIDWKVNY